jgi:predicted unusual protein kinase regulating ubiquinone biosynthesis (AarF/ABC1/UbiB family)
LSFARRAAITSDQGYSYGVVKRLSRYGDFARFIATYGRAGVVTPQGTEVAEQESTECAADAEAFAREMEALGPTFIKLEQLLCTRGPLAFTVCRRVGGLQDDVAPLPYSEVVRTVEDDLRVRLSKSLRRVRRQSDRRWLTGTGRLPTST